MLGYKKDQNYFGKIILVSSESFILSKLSESLYTKGNYMETIKQKKSKIIISILIATVLAVIFSVTINPINAHAYTMNEKCTFNIEMKEGIAYNSSSQTKAVQQRLKYIGLYTDTVDGSYGPNTIAAVKKFQARNNLSVDGYAGPSTTAKLRSGYVVGKDASYGEFLFHAYPTYYIYAGTTSTGP